MIVLDQVSKSFDHGKTSALDNVSMTVERGETLVLIGASGSGKTTVLRLISALISPSAGSIRLNGEDLSALDPIALRRSMGYVFQGIGLFPHMTVTENVGLGLRLIGTSEARQTARADELLDMVGMAPSIYGHRFPDALSGGQQQRVAVARALATDPEILLMDEPFGALDALTREELQSEMIRLKNSLGKTIIFVTHDIFEAFALGDRIGVFHRGVLDQLGTRRDLMENPKTEFVSDLIAKPVEKLRAFQLMNSS